MLLIRYNDNLNKVNKNKTVIGLNLVLGIASVIYDKGLKSVVLIN
jgi:hypothetical protein